MKINSHTRYSKSVDYKTGDIVGLLSFPRLNQHPDIHISNSTIYAKTAANTTNEYAVCSVERYEKCYQFGRFVVDKIIEYDSQHSPGCNILYRLRATIDESYVALLVPELFISINFTNQS